MSSTQPFNAGENVESVSNTLKTPTPGQASSIWKMSAGGAGVKVRDPVVPARGISSTSAVKPNAQKWTILEQIVRDEVTGLTFQFDLRPNGRPRLIVTGGAIMFGNREIGFDLEGRKSDGGTHLAACPTPSWISGRV